MFFPHESFAIFLPPTEVGYVLRQRRKQQTNISCSNLLWSSSLKLRSLHETTPSIFLIVVILPNSVVILPMDGGRAQKRESWNTFFWIIAWPERPLKSQKDLHQLVLSHKRQFRARIIRCWHIFPCMPHAGSQVCRESSRPRMFLSFSVDSFLTFSDSTRIVRIMRGHKSLSLPRLFPKCVHVGQKWVIVLHLGIERILFEISAVCAY